MLLTCQLYGDSINLLQPAEKSSDLVMLGSLIAANLTLCISFLEDSYGHSPKWRMLLWLAILRSQVMEMKVCCRLLRAVGIRRRCRGDPFRWVDAVSTKRREFSYSAKRLVTTALLMLVVVHYFACLLWWTVRLQGYPDSKSPSFFCLHPIPSFTIHVPA